MGRRTALATAICVALSLAGTDAATADVSISDASTLEGNSGTVQMTFTVSKDTSAGEVVDYATGPLTAQSPGDYLDEQGTVSLGRGTTATATITVTVNGDTADEPQETFRVVLSGDVAFSDDVGVGTIIDDDAGADSDGDGVEDSADSCPTVAGPAPSGCPASEDSDGDGVPNASDACPMVAGTAPDGCPTTGGLPTPVPGETANLAPLGGQVFVRLPAGSAGGGTARVAQKGGFIPLEQARQVPIGTLVDTERGRVSLTTARDFEGGTQTGNFSRGLFQVLQAREAGAVTRLALKGSSFRNCGARGSGHLATAARRRLSRRTVRRLRGSATGSFRTRGRHSAATVRGTVWITADRCDGTLTTVKRGRVAVRDFRRKRTLVLRAGKRYLARAPSSG